MIIESKNFFKNVRENIKKSSRRLRKCPKDVVEFKIMLLKKNSISGDTNPVVKMWIQMLRAQNRRVQVVILSVFLRKHNLSSTRYSVSALSKVTPLEIFKTVLCEGNR